MQNKSCPAFPVEKLLCKNIHLSFIIKGGDVFFTIL